MSSASNVVSTITAGASSRARSCSVGIVVEVVTALHGPAKWFDPNKSTAPLTDGTVHGAGWAHVAVTVGIWVVVPLVAGMLRLRRHELSSQAET